MTRDELIAALEAAPGPSRELDAHIGECVRWMPEDAPGWLVNWTGPIKAEGDKLIAMHSDGKRGTNWHPPRFTGSLDAALTLAPDGWRWEASSFDRVTGDPRACIWLGEQVFFSFGSTPTIALCIAALKAGEGKDG